MLFYGKSEVGAVRRENQDCFGIFELLPGVTLALICDGMGGNAGGSVASRLAIDTFADMMRETLIPDDPLERAILNDKTIRRSLKISCEVANKAVWDRAAASEGKLEGMGTTLVGILTVGNESAWSINVGDSRLYMLDNNGMRQLTHDHSYVQKMVDDGIMSQEEAAVSPMRNIITRAVGTDVVIEPDIRSINLGFPGDGRRRLLLCSDGLYVCVDGESIYNTVMGQGTLQEKSEHLFTLAAQGGAPDNVTIILTEI